MFCRQERKSAHSFVEGQQKSTENLKKHNEEEGGKRDHTDKQRD